MTKLNIRIHECGSSASSLGPSPMGVLRVGRPRKDMLATKKNESSDDPIDWDDFDNVVKRVLLSDEDKDNFKGSTYRSVPVLGKGGSSVHICTLDDDTPLITIWPDYSNDSRGHVYVYNNNLDPAIFNKTCARIRKLCWGVEKALSGNYYYPLTFHPFASREKMNQYFLDVDNLDENCGGVSAASRGAVPTGAVERKSESKKNESVNPIASIYGDGGLNTYEHSADGFFPTDNDTLAKAVYNNDVETIKKLHDSNLKTYEEPDELTRGWQDDYDDYNDDSTHYWYYDWDWDYDQSFVKDFRRVIGLTDNQDALRLMLQYEPDFIVCSADFGNAIHAGYDKELIKRLFYNIWAAVDDDDDLRVNYLGDEDYVTPDNPDPIENIEKFLKV